MIHQKLLKDDFIKENLILSIMRVFIDAERLGTSNQFYERFNVRNKVLQLVNEVFKKHQEILIDNIMNYANEHSDDATQMLTLLMGDVTYLIEEVIQRLIDIRNYQELKDNAELYKLKNFLSENECPSSIETLSCDTGISVKNLNRFLEQKDFSEITSQLEIDMSSNTNIEL